MDVDGERQARGNAEALGLWRTYREPGPPAYQRNLAAIVFGKGGSGGQSDKSRRAQRKRERQNRKAARR